MATPTKNMTFDVNLLPATTGDHNLGSSDLKWNINGSKLTIENSINQLLIGSGTAGQAGSASVAYKPTLWTFNTEMTPTIGDIITIKIPTAGVNSGIWMSVNNGTNYYPVAIQGATRLTTEFGVNVLLTLIYETGINTTTYGTTKDGAAAGASTSTYSGARWRVLNYYNSNTTYSAMSVAEMKTGTATSSRTIRADYLKTFLSTLGGTNLTLTHDATNGIILNHDSSGVTATNTAGFYKVKYDAQGHITGTTSVTKADLTNLLEVTPTDNTGTVTSVAASGSDGITISGSPITTSGTIAIGLNLSTAINGLSEGTSPAQANDYLIAQFAGGGTTTTTYHRRKVSNVVNANIVKAALGTNATHDNQFLRKDGTWQVTPDTKVTHTLGTTTKYYITGTTSNATNTGGDTFDTGIYATTTAGELSAVRHSFNISGSEKAYVTFNNTDQSLDFIFT